MPRIRITPEAKAAIRSAAGFTPERLHPDGFYYVELEEDTLERLDALRQGDESLSDTIVRTVRLATDSMNN